MIPLTRRKAAQLLECICIQRKCTPQSILAQLPYLVCDSVVLTRIGSAFYLKTIPAPLPDASQLPYVLHIDDRPMYSQASSYNAVKLAEHLCEVYPLAYLIEVYHNDTRLFQWKRIGVGQWINQ